MTVALDTVRLFEVEPDFERFVAEDDREQLSRLRVPVLELGRGPCALRGALAERGAFGAVVLEGLLIQRLRVGHRSTMYLEGPGDLVGRLGARPSALAVDRGTSAIDGTRLALLGREVLLAIQRYPTLAAGLHTRGAEQVERLAMQLAICQLPRVDDRLLVLLWWLAESWGRVTAAGTVLPLAMTHDVLGALVGARRPTVTLALGELSERGAIARQDQGWLLIEAPPALDRSRPDSEDPAVIPAGEVWRAPRDAFEDARAEHAELLETVERLREQHRASAAEVDARMRALREQRQMMAARREQLMARRPAPSSR
jgi:CRP/FNR family cyclic AMP-dependent transcriptional regulator